MKDINSRYGIETGNAKNYFKEQAQQSPDVGDYIMGYHVPQYAAGGAVLWGAVSSVFSNRGQMSNSQLYGSPF